MRSRWTGATISGHLLVVSGLLARDGEALRHTYCSCGEELQRPARARAIAPLLAPFCVTSVFGGWVDSRGRAKPRHPRLRSGIQWRR